MNYLRAEHRNSFHKDIDTVVDVSDGDISSIKFGSVEIKNFIKGELIQTADLKRWLTASNIKTDAKSQMVISKLPDMKIGKTSFFI